MHSVAFTSLLLFATTNAFSASNISDHIYGPIPGESSSYNTYDGVTALILRSTTEPILPTSNGDETHVPSYDEGKPYYAVFFHGVLSITMPFDTKASALVIAKEFEEKGASVVAGPLIILLQPAGLGESGI
ncbi:hypothetical protein K493DRAFT_352631 [Basidiobolus meristosporus CBS 931.73]|uniref:Alpha/beta-hydrolase n=1 Tax=Basidiobolus meristosporus CBS 931.73 TaxID=1314790 RepID=A0A1Y1Y8C2_9FUNG|nr:hypothetical protein K493DRAFT_352631 [Basidiobolus meristosporus CBS 931.73]|eukprot:ORX94272.1 hypothetical protein K493DRAFT_352631 [Basidiobolus meristosporus CBS 931.73]